MKKSIITGIILGIGIGIILTTSINMIINKNENKITDAKFIKSEARKLGMIDPAEYFNKVEPEHNIKLKNHHIEKVIVEIPEGASSEKIAAILKKNHLITSEKEFLRIVHSKNVENKLIWGRYEFTTEETVNEIIERIVNGREVFNK